MLLNKIRNFLAVSGAVSGVLIPFSGCSLINEDLPECESRLSVRFIYDYNLKFADAFCKEVTSVNVWAFDTSGKLVWSDAASGDVLKEPNFAFDTPLTPGTYDFVSWCGLKDNDDFNLATYTPNSKEELETTLMTLPIDGNNISKSNLPGLFHGVVSDETFVADEYSHTFKTVTVPLMKDTKDIRILLQRYNGDKIEKDEFDALITIPNGSLAWNNDVIDPSRMITYTPWNVKFGSVSLSGQSEQSKTIGTISALLFELSTSRLMVDADAVLTIRRTSDNKDIIRVPIIDYFLLVRGHYGDIPDQEYLDRQDDYSILFFIDENDEWYMSAGIYINSWAVVPPQENPIN